MMLQALCDYYDRKRSLEPTSIPPVGFEENAVSFVVVIDTDGRFVTIDDIRIGEGKRKRGKAQFVPQRKDRTGSDSWKTAFLLWDHPRYVFGVSTGGDDDKAKKRLAAFKSRITQSFPDPTSDRGVNAVVLFYENQENPERVRQHELWPLIEDTNGNVTFRLRDEMDFVCQSPTVREAVTHEFDEDEGMGRRQCLVGGLVQPIAALHPATPVPGSQATAKLHSFNLPAFVSFRKKQGANAPVGKQATFAYTTSLNYLLDSRNRPSGKQCLHVGDAWVVFWAGKQSVLEESFADIFDEPSKDDPDSNARAIRALFVAPQQGVPPIQDRQTPFFVLGLAPNSARVAVRFWHVGTVAELAGHIHRHFADLIIVRRERDYEYVPLKSLLNSTAQATQKYPRGDPEKVPPSLGGDLMQAILTGSAYPETLLQGAIRRIRAEREVSYPRASLVKACINRQSRNQSIAEKELTVSLDLSNINPGYRLGRLFAVLEKIQEEANRNINATIRDRFYGAASAAPVTVFSNLMRLKNHHLAKLENTGRRVNFERVITEIVDGIGDFPPHMSLADQGRFAIGYYHQRHALFSKSLTPSKGE